MTGERAKLKAARTIDKDKALLIVVICLSANFALGADQKVDNVKLGGQQQAGKTRDHLNKVYGQHRKSNIVFRDDVQQTLQELLKIYKESIKPLEEAYSFVNLNKGALLEAEILAKPLIVFVGPWSTGKTSFINYLLDIEDKDEKLHTGAEPTTTDFIVLQNGSQYHTLTGMQLVSDRSKAFTSLEKYGQNFVQRLQGIEIKSPLLDVVTLVDTPGIIENKKQQERGYPFSEVIQWFLQRASLIFLVFDPSKLEVGSELEIVFNQLRGYESKLKLLLNKADTVNQQELMKVYGALFWNLAPLVHSVEPPRVYVGSFWSKAKTDHAMSKLFLEEEQTLMLDIRHVIQNQVEDKIVYIRRHAYMVRLHALIVNSFLQAFKNNYGYFSDKEVVWYELVNHPEKYKVFQEVLKHHDISKHDLPDVKTYVEFFSINKFESFAPLNTYCPHFYGQCDMELLVHAISVKLPALLDKFKHKKNQSYCTKDTCS